jgi:hypothetical protein
MELKSGDKLGRYQLLSHPHPAELEAAREVEAGDRRYHEFMAVGTLISVDEYLRTSFHPDCDFIEGEVLERNAGKRKHSYAQGEIVSWFNRRKEAQLLQSLA